MKYDSKTKEIHSKTFSSFDQCANTYVTTIKKNFNAALNSKANDRAFLNALQDGNYRYEAHHKSREVYKEVLLSRKQEYIKLEENQ